MIICEGVDLTGKSTLARALSLNLDMEVVALGKPEPEVRHWDQAIKALKAANWRTTIFDRLVIGSVIYGNYLNDTSNYKPVTSGELDIFLKKLEEKKGLIIWAKCEVEDLRVRYAQRGDPYLTLAQIEDINVMYERLMYSIQRRYPYFLQYNSTKWAAGKWVEAYHDELKEYSH
jgi:hypothetical protein